jgi:hypothetical protein
MLSDVFGNSSPLTTTAPPSRTNAYDQPEAVLNRQLLQQNQIQSNWKYRQYLTHNALAIQKQNFVEAAADIGYTEESIPKDTNKISTPYAFSSYLDNSTPRGYHSSDLKNAYLQKEQLESRKFAPTIKNFLPF